MKTQRILAPVDGSKLSLFALKKADQLAAQSSGEVTMMFVHEPATVHLMDDDFPEPKEMTNKILATAQHCMEKMAATVMTIPEASRHIVIERGSPEQTIIDRSAEYDLIVMSTHGHTGLEHIRLGSVAERVVRGAHCEVLVVKQPAGASD